MDEASARWETRGMWEMQGPWGWMQVDGCHGGRATQRRRGMTGEDDTAGWRARTGEHNSDEHERELEKPGRWRKGEATRGTDRTHQRRLGDPQNGRAHERNDAAWTKHRGTWARWTMWVRRVTRGRREMWGCVALRTWSGYAAGTQLRRRRAARAGGNGKAEDDKAEAQDRGELEDGEVVRRRG
ncbi:uncharacterized protein BXZ73DRAFT_80132 [Epithele typhae]|uniref:uncharacterized protein n=1 Tax=Epithele typhae TaxID=378194 RepID=UPI002008B0DB|nr:uncharacterized protein BXZ73DRAFT_80132 [Epithele typhae]KAH9920561.1 hypothetical protein BXZ73DRAFT_80132 [Epithele typhae]